MHDPSADRGDEAPSPVRAVAARTSADELTRTARELVAAYGAAAGTLMRQRMCSVWRRGDVEAASLWHAVARAVDEQLTSGAAD